MPGLWFEEFQEGMVFDHRWTRTITEADNKWFSLLTMNTQPLHIDSHAAANSVWKRGHKNNQNTQNNKNEKTVDDTTFGTTIANLGMTDVKFPHPLFEGDTVHCTTEVLAKRESKSRPGAGIVDLHIRTYNQHDKLVAECKRQAFMIKRPA